MCFETEGPYQVQDTPSQRFDLLFTRHPGHHAERRQASGGWKWSPGTPTWGKYVCYKSQARVVVAHRYRCPKWEWVFLRDLWCVCFSWGSDCLCCFCNLIHSSDHSCQIMGCLLKGPRCVIEYRILTANVAELYEGFEPASHISWTFVVVKLVAYIELKHSRDLSFPIKDHSSVIHSSLFAEGG